VDGPEPAGARAGGEARENLLIGRRGGSAQGGTPIPRAVVFTSANPLMLARVSGVRGSDPQTDQPLPRSGSVQILQYTVSFELQARDTLWLRATGLPGRRGCRYLSSPPKSQVAEILHVEH
jgi:hypothetical protein